MGDHAKDLTLRGLFWNTIDRVGNQIIVTVVGVIMARLLDVKDFAVIAVLGIFSTVATSFVDSGLATSLVRSREIDEQDFSTMFVFNLVVSSMIYVFFFFTAPFIADYYKIPGLDSYARVLFLQILIQAFGIVQYVKAIKNSQFHVTARINVFAVFFSGLFAIVLALLDFGAWVLVLQPVLYSSFRTALLWLWGNWKISFKLSKAVLKKHMKFSLSFMGANMIGKVLSPFYSSFIGKQYSDIQTGYYYQANKWGETPNLLISSIVQGTTLSTLTPLQDDYPRFLNACRKTMSTLAFVLFPVSLLVISIAEPGFIYVLTAKYRDSVLYFQLLCFAGLFISLTAVNLNFVTIKGKSKYALILEIVKFILALGFLFCTYNKGILNIILGLMTVRIACFILSSVFRTKVYGYHLWLQVKDLFPSFLMSSIAAIICYLPQYFALIDHYLLLIILQSLIFILVYCGLCYLTKNAIWIEVSSLIKKKLTQK